METIKRTESIFSLHDFIIKRLTWNVSNLQARTGKEKVGRDGETDGETKTDRKRKGGTKTENDGTKRGDYTFHLLNYCHDKP